MDRQYHIISTLVADKPGVLQRIAGLFNRRGFNIDSITVGVSEVEGLSRMVITVNADECGLEQVTKQLNKLVDVIKIKDITKTAVARELCLIKVHVPDEKARAEIIQYTDIFRANIVDVIHKFCRTLSLIFSQAMPLLVLSFKLSIAANTNHFLFSYKLL